jgi:tetratricopeptide (TPR) repeat protein
MLSTTRCGSSCWTQSVNLAPSAWSHTRHFTEFAEQADAAIDGPDTEAWLKRLETEIDNVRTALAWSVGERDGDAALRLSAALWPFWEMRGYAREGLRWLEQTLELPVEYAQTAQRAKAFNAVGTLEYQLGDFAKARASYNRGLQIYEALVDARGIHSTINNIAIAAWRERDIPAALALLRENLKFYRSINDEVIIASTLTNLGIIAIETDDLDLALSLFDESLAIKLRLQDDAGAASLQNNLGYLRERAEDYAAADSLYIRSLIAYARLGDNPNTAIMLHNTGNIAALQEQHTRAVTLHGAAHALRKVIDIPLAAEDQERVDIVLLDLKQKIGCAAFNAAWSAGCAMSAEAAAAYARDPDNMI